jgi:hypothetical protein
MRTAPPAGGPLHLRLKYNPHDFDRYKFSYVNFNMYFSKNLLKIRKAIFFVAVDMVA